LHLNHYANNSISLKEFDKVYVEAADEEIIEIKGIREL
jgi:hypothetical protein